MTRSEALIEAKLRLARQLEIKTRRIDLWGTKYKMTFVDRGMDNEKEIDFLVAVVEALEF